MRARRLLGKGAEGVAERGLSRSREGNRTRVANSGQGGRSGKMSDRGRPARSSGGGEAGKSVDVPARAWDEGDGGGTAASGGRTRVRRTGVPSGTACWDNRERRGGVTSAQGTLVTSLRGVMAAIPLSVSRIKAFSRASRAMAAAMRVIGSMPNDCYWNRRRDAGTHTCGSSGSGALLRNQMRGNACKDRRYSRGPWRCVMDQNGNGQGERAAGSLQG